MGLLSLLIAATLAAPSARTSSALSAREFERLLQGFADQAYMKGFRRLGELSDCDHAHLLIAPGSERPAALLYHTQELDRSLDPAARNWLQWPDGRVEDAAPYERRSYPTSASWDWFRRRRLPELRAQRTVTAEMLDPERLGAGALRGVQWTFTRVPCASAEDAEQRVAVVLPTREKVCLRLGRD